MSLKKQRANSETRGGKERKKERKETGKERKRKRERERKNRGRPGQCLLSFRCCRSEMYATPTFLATSFPYTNAKHMSREGSNTPKLTAHRHATQLPHKQPTATLCEIVLELCKLPCCKNLLCRVRSLFNLAKTMNKITPIKSTKTNWPPPEPPLIPARKQET